MTIQNLSVSPSAPTRIRDFWLEAIAIRGSISPRVWPHVLIVGAFSAGIVFISEWFRTFQGIELSLSVTPFEYVGVALGLLLVLRTNAGHDRWWEARKLWGGIVNQSRNLAISSVTYGPDREHWRKSFVQWAAVFPHVCRQSLRGERNPIEIADLIGYEAAIKVTRAEHMPSYVIRQLAELLRAVDENDARLSPFSFMQIDRERAMLIDHIGACERILKTPLPLVYSIKIRRFILFFLATLPFALLHRMGTEWLIPPIMMLVAYPLFSLDQIGIELQNPFDKSNLSHLPLDNICKTIEGNLLALLKQQSEPALLGPIQEALHFPKHPTLEVAPPKTWTRDAASA